MDAGNFNAATRSCKILVPRTHFIHQRVKAEPVLERRSNSQNVKSEDITGEYASPVEKNLHNSRKEIAQLKANSGWIENQHSMEVADDHKVGAGDTDLVEQPSPLATDSNASLIGGEEDDLVEKPSPLAIDTNASLVGGEEDDYEPVVQETCAQLEAKIERLRKQNFMSCQQMQKISKSCLRLRKENCRLLKHFKKVCPPDTIAYLEARNPYKEVDNQD